MGFQKLQPHWLLEGKVVLGGLVVASHFQVMSSNPAQFCVLGVWLPYSLVYFPLGSLIASGSPKVSGE